MVLLLSAYSPYAYVASYGAYKMAVVANVRVQVPYTGGFVGASSTEPLA